MTGIKRGRGQGVGGGGDISKSSKQVQAPQQPRRGATLREAHGGGNFNFKFFFFYWKMAAGCIDPPCFLGLKDADVNAMEEEVYKWLLEHIEDEGYRVGIW